MAVGLAEKKDNWAVRTPLYLQNQGHMASDVMDRPKRDGWRYHAEPIVGDRGHDTERADAPAATQGIKHLRPGTELITVLHETHFGFATSEAAGW